jgi:sugar phosphate permease
VGIILALASSGVLCEWLGWPSVFYMSGGLGMLLMVTWVWLIEDTPAEHRLASPHEKKFIEDSLASCTKQNEVKHVCFV